MKLKIEKKGIMFFHKEIGEGTTPEGNECRLLQTDNGIHMQIYPKDKTEKAKGNWTTYTLTYEELSNSIFNEITKLEAETKTQVPSKEGKA